MSERKDTHRGRVFGEEAAQIRDFGNALRECLGLGPLYHDEDRSDDSRMIHRFYIPPFEEPWRSSIFEYADEERGR